MPRLHTQHMFISSAHRCSFSLCVAVRDRQEPQTACTTLMRHTIWHHMCLCNVTQKAFSKRFIAKATFIV